MRGAPSLAGFKAEIRLCEQRNYIVPDALGVLLSPDWCDARKTISKLSESYLANDGVGPAQHKLEKQSEDAVLVNWAAIEMLATSLLAEPWVKREELPSRGEWSKESLVKHIPSDRIVAILDQVGIHASL